MLFHTPQKQARGGRGFTLVEMLVYVAVVAVLGGALTSFLISNLSAYDRTQAWQNTFNNVNDALQVVTNEIRYAKSTYTPTSVFASDAGQLSLETTLNVPAGEAVAFVDYYLDNGRIYEKRETQTPNPVTSERVFVERLRFDKQTATTTLDSITIQIQARANTQSVQQKDQARVFLRSSASLRGAY